MKRTAFWSTCAAIILAAPFAAKCETVSPERILQEMREFRTFGTVLMVAAHPDDENRSLLAFLSKSRDFRTAYLSINRGDGGQNEIGPEFDAKLGVIRTQELLAGRRIDGARQFFTRAIDFGYSKSMEETLRIWDQQAVLGDVVRVIRTFRPDVIVTVFSPVPGNTHGHHTASAYLAREAFKLAGDPTAYPEQIAEGLATWQPVRIVQNGGNGLTISGGNTDPATGETIQAIASRTSAQHKTQFAGGGRGGGGGGGNNFSAGFSLLDGASGTGLMDGVDMTWARVPNGGAEIARLADEIIAKLDTNNPSASVDALLTLHGKLAAMQTTDSIVAEKRALLDKILQACLGLSVTTTVPQAEVIPGETLRLHSIVKAQSKIPIEWTTTRFGFDINRLLPEIRDKFEKFEQQGGYLILTNQAITQDVTSKLAAVVPLSQPYWLRKESAVGIYRVDDPKLISQPENPPAFPIEYVFKVGDQTLVVPDEPVQAGTESGPFEARRTLKVVAPVSLHCEDEVALFTSGSSRDVKVEVTATRANTKGELFLDAPTGWTITPKTQPFNLASSGEHKTFTFKISAPKEAASAQITARAKVGDATYENQRMEISYPHIPLQLLQPVARIKAVTLNLAIRGKSVGYLPGAGDSVADALKQMGYEVTMLTGADLTPEKLRGLDAVVIGVRAFNERTDFAANFPALLVWVEQGGNVIAQYNRPNGLNARQLGPYPLSIQGQAPPLRVTDENAPVTFLLSDHPALNMPNKINAADFDGWVQERGAYFASTWDEHYEAPLAMSDPGEHQPNSSLLIAKHGKGYYVYTSLAFFRQLPAGVPGAYRLFANLVSLGK